MMLDAKIILYLPGCQIGGFVVYESPYDTYLKLIKGGVSYWIIVHVSNGGDCYELTIVEKAEMVQEVAEAKSHASIDGIYFDFDKAEIKPELEPALKEIAKLLEQNPNLKLFIVGHTDNVGDIDYNLKLSKARADAVVKELTTKYKISPKRLKAYGVGPLAPVASNKQDEGRAKNRGVGLVEQ